MPDELVRRAKTVLHHRRVVQHHGVLSRRPLDQSHRAQRLDFAHEPEGTRPPELPLEQLRRDARGIVLSPDQRMRKVDRDVEVEMVRGSRLVSRVSVGELDALGQSPVLRAPRMLADSGCAQRLEERARAAVHDRRLRTVQRDDEIVDLERSHGGEHVLHRVHRVRLLAQLRAPIGEHGLLGPRPDRRGACEVSALEHDPCTARRRPKHERAVDAEVKARAGDRCVACNGAPHQRSPSGSRASSRSIARISDGSLNIAA